MESEDYHFYQGLVYLLENDVSTLGYDLTFSTEVCSRGGDTPQTGPLRPMEPWGHGDTLKSGHLWPVELWRHPKIRSPLWS